MLWIGKKDRYPDAGREIPDIPEIFSTIIKDYSKNRFRLVSGSRETTVLFGETIPKYVVLDLKQSFKPKGNLIVVENYYDYKCIPRYFLEIFVPMEILGTRQYWDSMRYADGVDILGDYPSNGVWMGIMPIEGENGEFVELNDRIVADIIHTMKLSNTETYISFMEKITDEKHKYFEDLKDRLKYLLKGRIKNT